MECERRHPYCKGLTQSQVGDVFEDVYEAHYSKASISRMIEYLRSDVEKWLNRSLESYYPIVFVDAVHVKVHGSARLLKPFTWFSASRRIRSEKSSASTTIHGERYGLEGIFRDLFGVDGTCWLDGKRWSRRS